MQTNEKRRTKSVKKGGGTQIRSKYGRFTIFREEGGVQRLLTEKKRCKGRRGLIKLHAYIDG